MPKVLHCRTCTCPEAIPDAPDEFIRTMLIPDPNQAVKTHDIHTAYIAWMYANRPQAGYITQTSLTRRLTALGYPTRKASQTRVVGYRLRLGKADNLSSSASTAS